MLRICSRHFCLVVFASFFLSCQSVSCEQTNIVETRDCMIWSKADIQGMLEKWRKCDGEAGALISDVFCDFVVGCPELFLEVMAHNRNDFGSWMESLQGLSFVDYGYDCLDRECLRRHMLTSLEFWKSEDEQVEELRKMLIKRLKEIVVEEI